MKTKKNTMHSPRRGWLSAACAGLALCAAATLPAFGPSAFATAGAGLPPPPITDDEAADDETIGTLPIVDDGSTDIDIMRIWRDPRPALYVQGSSQAIANSLLAVYGHGVATVENLGAGNVGITFYGNVQLIFDRGSLDDLGLISIGLSVQSALGSQTTLYWGEVIRPIGSLGAGHFALPVSAMEANGALDAAALSAVTYLESGAVVQQRFEALPELLVLTQSL